MGQDGPVQSSDRARPDMPGGTAAPAGAYPGAAVTVAMGSSATSTPRELPALAHLWSGHVVPLDLDVLASETTSSSWRCPGSVGGSWRRSSSPAGAGSLTSRARSGSRTTMPGRSGSAHQGAARRHDLRPHRRTPATHDVRAAGVVPGLLSDRGRARDQAARRRRPRGRRDRH